MENRALATCRHCGGKKEVETVPLVNVGTDPGMKERIKDGSLFVWECPSCGARNLAAFPLLYHDPDRKIMIWLLPEGDIPREKMEAVTACLSDLEGYTLRRVGSAGELVEKVNLADAGLDDCVVELCKYVTRQELDGKAAPDGPLRFYRMSGADNEITFSFPMKGNMMSLNVGFNVYEDCLGILQRNPAARPAAGFAKVDAAWVASVLR